MENNKLDVDIQKTYQDFYLDVKFSLEKGKTLGILGPSGCGKSVTLKSIAGIVTPDNGIVSINNHVVFDRNHHINQKPQQRNVGYLFQNYALFPNMTVNDNILIGAKTKRINVDIQHVLETFDLCGLETKYPNQLSGGQKQRVALARLFAYHPNVILLDEPFSALDAHLKEKLQLNLKRFLQNYDGYSILVTHNRDEAYQLSDELLVIDHGKVIDYGNVKNVFKKPRNVVSARLTGCKNISRIQKVDDYHVKALDWNNIVLTVSQPVTESIRAIGIRAHDFIPMDKVIDTVNNYIPVTRYEVCEMPFEWYVTLDNGLWYKQEKHKNEQELITLSKYLMIKPEDIILLTDLQ